MTRSSPSRRTTVRLPFGVTLGSAPTELFKVLANIAGLVLAIGGIQVFWVNRRFLPRALRPPLWREVLLLSCAAFYAFFSFFVMRDYVRAWQLGQLPVPVG